MAQTRTQSIDTRLQQLMTQFNQLPAKQKKDFIAMIEEKNATKIAKATTKKLSDDTAKHQTDDMLELARMLDSTPKPGPKITQREINKLVREARRATR
jgi:hypothetical protein